MASCSRCPNLSPEKCCYEETCKNYDGVPKDEDYSRMTSSSKYRSRVPICSQPKFSPRTLPPGLGTLATLDEVFITQQLQMLEVFLTQVEQKNRYQILGEKGGLPLFNVIERSNFYLRYLLKAGRPFEIEILDASKQEVIHLHRPYAMGCCCNHFCRHSMEVSAPPGNFIGRIKQDFAVCGSSFTINNEQDQPQFKIIGPSVYNLTFDIKFKIYSVYNLEESVGVIEKQWAGLIKSMGGANDFMVTFPESANEKMRAVLVGAAFLMDYMYFEKKGL